MKKFGVRAPVAVSAAVGAGLWFLSGLVFFAVAWRASRWQDAIALVVPPTVPFGTWSRIAPWNVALPLFGAALFGGLFGLALMWLLGRRGGPAAPRWAWFLGSWFMAVVAAWITAGVWAVGSTIASFAPTGLAWAFRSAQPDLLTSGFFGVVWGWAPALVFVVLIRQHTSLAAGTDLDGGANQNEAVTISRGSLPRWAFMLVGILTIAAALGVGVGQSAAVRATRVAAGGTPDGLPTVTPTPTEEPAAAPPQVAPDPVQPGPNWCAPESTSLLVSGTDAALGHRALTLVLINRSTTPCVVNGYPDVAFADAEGHALTVGLEHGTSYMATDPGAADLVLAPGGSAGASLSWLATGARTGTGSRLWAAAYPGTQRSPLAIDSDIVDGSRISVTAWAAPAAG
ncbi:MAG: hypothetical protein JWP70_1269 [Leifsonia sp.]|jgi:hypothetical protein|nr:hypothetical protein [Leifsonia sp.]